MNQYLRAAVEAVLTASLKCSVDNHGFIQHLPAHLMAELHVEFDKYNKKHFKPRLRA